MTETSQIKDAPPSGTSSEEVWLSFILFLFLAKKDNKYKWKAEQI